MTIREYEYYKTFDGDIIHKKIPIYGFCNLAKVYRQDMVINTNITLSYISFGTILRFGNLRLYKLCRPYYENDFTHRYEYITIIINSNQYILMNHILRDFHIELITRHIEMILSLGYSQLLHIAIKNDMLNISNNLIREYIRYSRNNRYYKIVKMLTNQFDARNANL
jgi:hypothetical protein